MNAEDRLLRDRFAGLAGRDDGDWDDVRLRARRSGRRTAVLMAAAGAALVVTGLGLGGQVIGLFEDTGKPVALADLSPQDRETAVFSLCKHIELVERPGKTPVERCGEGLPTIEEVANDGTTFHWKFTYPDGSTCLASGPVRGIRDPNRGLSRITLMSCNVGAPSHKVVPSPQRPITADLAFAMRRNESRAHLTNASGLAGAGVVSAGLIAKDGSVLKTPVRERSYDFGKSIPRRNWIAIAAFDASGNEVYREPVNLARRQELGVIRPGRNFRPVPPPAIPAGAPLQHGAAPAATIDVYRSSVVSAHFTSTSSEEYNLLRRAGVKAGDARVGLSCGDVAYGAGRWLHVGGGTSLALAQDMRTDLSNEHGGFPSTPFDYCEVAGTYGRYWNDEEGTHELVEVPFTATGRRYLDERATARDLAYFVRTREMWRIRKAVFRGESTPSADEVARQFGERVVPVAARDATAPLGKIGVWTDGKLIVASELTPAGRRLFVTVQAMRIGPNNIRDLSFPF